MKHYLLLILIALIPSLLKAQAGNPDSTFGTNGHAILPSGIGLHPTDRSQLLVPVAGGKLLYASTNQNGLIRLTRTDANGLPDATFGTAGITTFGFSNTIESIPSAIIVIDNKIYVGAKAGTDMGLARLSLSGVLDTTFSRDGMTTIDFGGTNEVLIGLNQYNSIPAALHFAGSSDSTWAVGKLKLDGSLDPSFSTDGKATIDVGTGRMVGAVLYTGTTFITMAGYSRLTANAAYQFTTVRYNMSNATVNATSRVSLTPGHNICKAVHYIENELYMTGECRNGAGGRTQVGVLAVTAGTTTAYGRFGVGGRVLWNPPGADAVGHSIGYRDIGGQLSVFVGGATGGNSFLLRLDRFGFGDPLFGTNGYRIIPFGVAGERIKEIAVVGSRTSERIIGVGTNADQSALLWSKTKVNNFYNVTPGWFSVKCPTTVNLKQIYSGGNATNWILGDSGRFYYYYTASDFLGTSPPIYSYHRINTVAGLTGLKAFKTSASPSDFWLVGDTGFLAKSGADAYSNTWVKTRLNTRQNLNGVGSSASGLGYIVGDSGLLIYNYPWNAQNRKLATGTRQKLNCIINQSYIVGDSGVILKYVSEFVWSRPVSPTTRNLYGVGTFPGTAIAVGAGGTILRSTNGILWTQIPIPFTNDLYSVDGVNGAAVIVGAGGLILKSLDAGLTWRQQLSPTTENLRSVIVESINSASAVGDNGTVIRTLSGGIFVGNKPNLSSSSNINWNLYPNPASKAITLQFSLARPGRIKVDLLDLTGRRLDVMIDDAVQAGEFTTHIPLHTTPGCYMVRLQVDGQTQIKKLIIE